MSKKPSKPKRIPVMVFEVDERAFKRITNVLCDLGGSDILPMHKGHGPAEACTPDCGPTKVR